MDEDNDEVTRKYIFDMLEASQLGDKICSVCGETNFTNHMEGFDHLMSHPEIRLIFKEKYPDLYVKLGVGEL